MKFSIFYICICIIFFLKCLSGLKSETENKKIKKINESNKRKVSKYDYSSLKKRFDIENEKEKKAANGIDKKRENVVVERENIINEYEKCMSVIEKEFKDKADNESQKVIEELKKLCLKKKIEDKIEKEEEEKKKEKKRNQENEQSDSLQKKNKEIKSQLGLSNKIIVPTEILNESLSEIKNCIRNYREKCPLNWKVSKDNNKLCIAPDSYIGPCEKKISNDIDISEKKVIEKRCLVFWQCDNNCVQDFENYLCPLDWIKMNDEYCKAPEHYLGNCLNKIKFSNMSNKEKLIYSNLCDVRWPCKEKCDRDYSVLCPEGWIEGNNEYCIATNRYKGNCKKKIYLKHLDKIMKQTYEQKCQFNYPCIDSCEKNYDDLCPNFWLPVNEKECAPSEYYNGNCNENYIFKNRNIEEKKQFEKLCNVSYRCLEKCKRDYSYNCPIGWKETLSYCLAPNSYKYNCDKLMKKNMNEREKKEISKKCHIFWPCSNYEILLKKLIYNMSEEDYVSIINGPVDNATGKIINN
ncbi:CPW-WPC family protein, putative [Plasmodium relictum]|uniref:CPW-WPC family protein, putative n=1 Tax=Plasmodium relictum TaxID=85471 RepID=A0A1J1H4Y7_PLARL|nr:CPW-WPC family protein, putative [Plasmodium relictum]CRG99753.1 CPW-WPC family protein, putative [Plasmodium relictum]